MSFDINREIQKGERAAKAQERAKRRGAALARGTGSRKSKSGFSRSAGHRAAARGGRGIVIKAHKSGRGFKGILDYANDPKKSPQIVFTNCGTTAQDALRTMCRASSLRPAISKPVAHITMSLPPAIGKDERRWPEIVQELRDTLGIDDSWPCIAIRHNDTNHDHVHLIFGRVSVAGEVWDEWGNQLKCAAAEESIEQKFNLKIFPRDTQNQKSKPSKGEIEMGLRTGQLPPRLQIAAALKIATQGRPTIQQFVERLNAAGVGVRANVSPSTGKMNGFSFVFDGIVFSGSKVAKEYGWQQLEKVIDYEQNRDTDFLTKLDGSTGRAGADIAAAASIVNGLDRAVGSISPAAADDRTNRSDDPPAVDRASATPGTPEQSQARRDTGRAAQKPQPISAPTRPVLTAPPGFDRIEPLPENLRDWAGTLHNRIGKTSQDRLRALYDERSRMLAIRSASGVAVPDIKALDDQQIKMLLTEVEDRPIELSGNPDFCTRIQEVADRLGLKVVNPHEISAAEKKAAELRYEVHQRVQKKSADLPVHAPK